MMATKKRIGHIRVQVYWLFDPFTGRDMAEDWDDGIQPQHWCQKDLTTPERIAEKKRYDQCVRKLTPLCVQWYEKYVS